jgi:hypothetical protein
MNVNEIIKWLKKFPLIEEMPDEYVVSRREQEYRELIERIEPYRFAQEDGLEITLENPNISEFLVIPNGDIEFPEIDLERIIKRNHQGRHRGTCMVSLFSLASSRALGYIHS